MHLESVFNENICNLLHNETMLIKKNIFLHTIIFVVSLLLHFYFTVLKRKCMALDVTFRHSSFFFNADDTKPFISPKKSYNEQRNTKNPGKSLTWQHRFPPKGRRAAILRVTWSFGYTRANYCPTLHM